MLTHYLVPAILLGATSTLALAQAPDGGRAQLAQYGHMAQSGHAMRVGDGLRQSDNASDIVLADAAPTITSTTPSPAIGNDTVSRDYLRTARAALLAGRAGEAKQSLEMAQRRALDQASVPGQTASPNTGVFIARIIDARRALEKGDGPYAIILIDVALVH
jgi:hypothetical protein